MKTFLINQAQLLASDFLQNIIFFSHLNLNLAPSSGIILAGFDLKEKEVGFSVVTSSPDTSDRKTQIQVLLNVHSFINLLKCEKFDSQTV